LRGLQTRLGWVKAAKNIPPINCYISKTTEDRQIVIMKE